MIKGVRASLGGGRRGMRRVKFEQHSLPRVPGLMIYLSSDGLADQPNHLRQPFDTARLRGLLQDISKDSTAAQAKAVEQAINTHRGGAAQRDDITLLGVRL